MLLFLCFHFPQICRQNQGFELKNYMIASTYLATLNFAGLYLFFVPLAMIPVALNTALYQSVIVFIFALSYFFLKEEVNWRKVFQTFSIFCKSTSHYFQNFQFFVIRCSHYFQTFSIFRKSHFLIIFSFYPLAFVCWA